MPMWLVLLDCHNFAVSVGGCSSSTASEVTWWQDSRGIVIWRDKNVVLESLRENVWVVAHVWLDACD